MSELRIGILQQSKTSDMASNIKAIEEEVTDLARRGAELIILSELHNSLWCLGKEARRGNGHISLRETCTRSLP